MGYECLLSWTFMGVLCFHGIYIYIIWNMNRILRCLLFEEVNFSWGQYGVSTVSGDSQWEPGWIDGSTGIQTRWI